MSAVEEQIKAVQKRVKAIGECIKEAREQTGNSQEDLASKIGVSRVTVSGWERGILKKGPAPEILPILAETLRVPLATFNLFPDSFGPTKLIRAEQQPAAVLLLEWDDLPNLVLAPPLGDACRKDYWQTQRTLSVEAKTLP